MKKLQHVLWVTNICHYFEHEKRETDIYLDSALEEFVQGLEWDEQLELCWGPDPPWILQTWAPGVLRVWDLSQSWVPDIPVCCCCCWESFDCAPTILLTSLSYSLLTGLLSLFRLFLSSTSVLFGAFSFVILRLLTVTSTSNMSVLCFGRLFIFGHVRMKSSFRVLSLSTESVSAVRRRRFINTNMRTAMIITQGMATPSDTISANCLLITDLSTTGCACGGTSVPSVVWGVVDGSDVVELFVIQSVPPEGQSESWQSVPRYPGKQSHLKLSTRSTQRPCRHGLLPFMSQLSELISQWDPS